MRRIGTLLAATTLAACEPTDVCHDWCEVQIDCYNSGDDADRAVRDCYAPYDVLLSSPDSRADVREECRDALEAFDCPV